MEQRPNILLITTDQHSAEALGHLGCNDVKNAQYGPACSKGNQLYKIL